eukprot:Platyproteum_vivax@DN6157_c0_g1_i1.p1
MDSASKEVLLHFYSCEEIPTFVKSGSFAETPKSNPPKLIQPYRALIDDKMAGLDEVLQAIHVLVGYHKEHFSFDHDPEICQMNVASTVGSSCLFEGEFRDLALLVTGCLDDLELLIEASENAHPDAQLSVSHKTLVESFNRMPNLYEDVDNYAKAVCRNLIKQSVGHGVQRDLEKYLKVPGLVADRATNSPKKVSFREDNPVNQNDAVPILESVDLTCQKDAMRVVLRLLSIRGDEESEIEGIQANWRLHMTALPYVKCEIPIVSKEVLPADENDTWRIARFYLPAKYARRHQDYCVGEPVQAMIRLPYQDFKIKPAASIQDAAAFFEEFLEGWDDRCIYLRTHPFGSNILMSHNANLYQELDYWRPQSNTMWPRFFCKT